MTFKWSNGNCRVMGILNVTPDSFSDGNEYLDVDKAVEHALRMESEGAEIIDIGAESTRPGSQSVTVEEQIKRLMPVVSKLENQLVVPISVDTTQSKVAQACFEKGACIVNDTSAGTDDPDMLAWVVKSACPVVLMHRGSASENSRVLTEVKNFLEKRALCYQEAGLEPTLICLDPGIGFGKNTADNITLTQELDQLTALEFAVLYGASRKRFIGELLKQENAKDRDAGSIAVASWASRAGVDWVRVHNIKETMSALRMQDILSTSHNEMSA